MTNKLSLIYEESSSEEEETGAAGPVVRVHGQCVNEFTSGCTQLSRSRTCVLRSSMPSRCCPADPEARKVAQDNIDVFRAV